MKSLLRTHGRMYCYGHRTDSAFARRYTRVGMIVVPHVDDPEYINYVDNPTYRAPDTGGYCISQNDPAHWNNQASHTQTEEGGMERTKKYRKYRINLINEQGCYFDGARDLTLLQCRKFATGRGGDYIAEVRELDSADPDNYVWYYRGGRLVRSINT